MQTVCRWCWFFREEALDMLQHIADQDPDNRIKWEIEFPASPAEFVPFLSTEIRIDEEEKYITDSTGKPRTRQGDNITPD